jgi:hypothetical protein
MRQDGVVLGTLMGLYRALLFTVRCTWVGGCKVLVSAEMEGVDG